MKKAQCLISVLFVIHHHHHHPFVHHPRRPRRGQLGHEEVEAAKFTRTKEEPLGFFS